MDLIPGSYEAILTRRLQESLTALGGSWSPLLITLTKTEKRFSPTTRYRDYAISRSLFHWESQSRTTADSPTGRRYQEHRVQGTHIMVFVRLHAEDRAFYFLGPASYVSHQAEMPMQITWKLNHPLPADLFMAYRAAAA